MRKLKIAIVDVKNSFSDGWIAYCKRREIPFVIVNPYSSAIIESVKGCSAFMWHFSHVDYRDMQCAKSIILSLETIGIKCFPDSKTCWHFDDKIAQNYLLESIGAPIVKSHVFYTKREALEWVNSAVFPLVFKLKGGAGSSNVMLARTSSEARTLITQCFGRGFRQYRCFEKFKEELRKYKLKKNKLRDLLRPLKLGLRKYPTEFDHFRQREMGYAYFQDFMPNNLCDIRVCVIGNKAFALKRNVRENDFRASGSGCIEYDRELIDERCVSIAFEVNKQLSAQCMAYDFVFNADGIPVIVEMSYCFVTNPIDGCEGYWSSDMIWHEGSNFDFRGWMVEQII